MNLLNAIAKEKEVTLVIKGHTRGKESGGLSLSEEKSLDRFGNVLYPDDQVHSPYLVDQSDVVIVYGSSICFEALRQGKTIIWPRFVCRNRTIFDSANVVNVVENEHEVIQAIRDAGRGRRRVASQSKLSSFFHVHVEGELTGRSVLDRYADRINEYLD